MKAYLYHIKNIAISGLSNVYCCTCWCLSVIHKYVVGARMDVMT